MVGISYCQRAETLLIHRKGCFFSNELRYLKVISPECLDVAVLVLPVGELRR